LLIISILSPIHLPAHPPIHPRSPPLPPYFGYMSGEKVVGPLKRQDTR